MNSGPHADGGGFRSGLRNPERAMRALGGIALGLEAVVALLAIQPIRVIQGWITGPQLSLLLFTVAAAIGLAGMLGRRWGWWLASALQVVLIAGGLLHWMIGAIGVLFGLAWLYVLYVRRRVLS
jgi:Protein of unknown function (DUF4233)